MQDEEIEKAMLYYLIFENYECELIDADFTTRLNKKIFKAIQNLNKQKKK